MQPCTDRCCFACVVAASIASSPFRGNGWPPAACRCSRCSARRGVPGVPTPSRPPSPAQMFLLSAANRPRLPLLLPCSATGQLDLLGLLRRLLSEAIAAEPGLACFATTGGGAGPASDGRQLVAAGWHAALVTAGLCRGAGADGVAAAQQLQHAAVARGFLPLLSLFVQAEVPAAAAAAAAYGATGALASGADGRSAEQMAFIQ